MTSAPHRSVPGASSRIGVHGPGRPSGSRQDDIGGDRVVPLPEHGGGDLEGLAGDGLGRAACRPRRPGGRPAPGCGRWPGSYSWSSPPPCSKAGPWGPVRGHEVRGRALPPRGGSPLGGRGLRSAAGGLRRTAAAGEAARRSCAVRCSWRYVHHAWVRRYARPRPRPPVRSACPSARTACSRSPRTWSAPCGRRGPRASRVPRPGTAAVAGRLRLWRVAAWRRSPFGLEGHGLPTVGRRPCAQRHGSVTAIEFFTHGACAATHVLLELQRRSSGPWTLARSWLPGVARVARMG